MLTAKSFRKRLIRCGIPADKIIGCSDEEIGEIEADAGLTLPKTYRSFLRIAGRGAGGFMGDMTIFYPKILGLTRFVRENFGDRCNLSERAFVFMERLGAVFLFFECTGNDDPRIYGWAEDEGRCREVWISFWSFVESELEVIE